MRREILYFIFISLLLFWGYSYPYQWWLQISDRRPALNLDEVANENVDDSLQLPEPFLGSSLISEKPAKAQQPSDTNRTDSFSGIDLATPVLDEMKVCFGEGVLTGLNSTKGDLGQVVIALQNALGPIDDDLLLEKKAVVKMSDGSTRTLVYEWISPEEGSDVYWHETDDDGFPKPIEMPDGSGRDLSAFDRIRQSGSSGKVSETRLIQFSSGMQIGVEKTDNVVESLSLKDEGHLVKCRKDAVKSFVCDCLN